MSESSAVSLESVNKNTPESPKNKVKKKKSLWKILLAIILILVVLVCLLLCGVRAYFRLSVREYYKKISEKTFEIPGLSEGLIRRVSAMMRTRKNFSSPAIAPITSLANQRCGQGKRRGSEAGRAVGSGRQEILRSCGRYFLEGKLPLCGGKRRTVGLLL